MTVATLTAPPVSTPRRSRPPLAGGAAASNATLVAAAVEGDGWAWETLVSRYRGLVAAITRSYRVDRVEADDVAQMVWLRLFEHLPRIRQPEALGAWVATVTRNSCLRLHRREGREGPSDDGLDERASDEAVEEELLAAERSAALRRALTGLPLRRRQLVEALLDQPELTYAELGRRIGMSAGSIGPTRRRSFEQLRSFPALASLAR